MLETGATQATQASVVGDGLWLTTLEQVAAETYPATITTGDSEISTTGTPIVTYTF
jgi:hypothetical protein